MDTTPELIAASDHSILVDFAGTDESERSRRIIRFLAALEEAGHAAIRNLHPGYASVLVTYEPRRAPVEEMMRTLAGVLARNPLAPPPEGRVIELPVGYGGEWGPDLEFVAAHNGLSAVEAAALHAAGEYPVRFLGFSPGFAYLGGLSPRLYAPRLAPPRTGVPAGSVAIGGEQTGVYPLDSPGGWRIIGRTPLPIFALEATPPARLRIGDRVRFRSVTAAEFECLAAEVERRRREGAPPWP